MTMEAAAPKTAEAEVKRPPVLPWMRVPITIDSDGNVPLSEVQGLDASLETALHASKYYLHKGPDDLARCSAPDSTF